jgi:uncharacterized protein (DUF1800 family)
MGDAEQSPSVSRRLALKLSSFLPALAAIQPPEPAAGLDTLTPPGSRQAARLVGPPPLPDLEVIALNRLTFGFSSQARAEFRALGGNSTARFEAFVHQQLDPAGINDSACQTRLNNAGFTTLNKSLTQLWSEHVVDNNQGWSYRMLPLEEVIQAAFIRAVYSKRQVFELLVDFWHNHFNMYGWHSYVAPVFVHFDRDVMRVRALGNFREMIESVAKSTSMLYYLDNYINKKEGFNENYARELLELHTLGAENYLGTGNPLDVPKDENGIAIGYVDNDVYEAARAFTGWRVDYSTWEPGVGTSGAFLYYEDWHDWANKLFMGQYMPANQLAMKDGKDVYDIIAAHPGTARHIARKLCRRFVSDQPSETLVEQAAQTFLTHKDAPDQLKRVMETILLSTDFRNTWGEKVKRPFEAAAGFFRATQAEFFPSDDFLWNYERMGQPLFGRFSPDGWPDVKPVWTSTNSMLQRWRLANQLMENWIDDTTIDVLSQTPAHIRTPNEIADFWIDRILGRPMHPVENRAEIVDFLAQGFNADFDLPQEQFNERVPRAVALLLMTPDFQLR